MINKKNIPLIIALAIPVLMIILVAAFIYLPGIRQKPKENFLYMTGDNAYTNYGINQMYEVNGGHLTQNSIPTTTPVVYPQATNGQEHFYVYNVSKDSATEVTFQEAQNYQLDSSSESNDGYIIQQGSGGGGNFIFGGGDSDYNSWFIKGHNRSRKLNIKLSGSSDYYYNFQFLGWVNQ